MSIGRELFLLSKRIGYEFSDTQLLQTALTQSSYANEMRGKGTLFPSNERLEFLGDAVLEVVISKFLYDNYKSSSEGALTKMRQYLVCEKTLAKIAAEIDLGDYLTCELKSDDLRFVEIIRQLGLKLGANDTENEIIFIENAIQKLQALSDEYLDIYEKKGSLVTKIGVLVAVFICIIIW